MSKQITPVWKLVFKPGHPHASELFYKGEKVGDLHAIDLSITADSPIPRIKFDVYTNMVEIVTDLVDPT